MKNKTEPIVYYNHISSKYDDLLNTNPLNTKIRDEVKKYFLKNVHGKYVLDFGGGTGKDLEWLTNNSFKVYFCEPSKQMREEAIKNFQKHQFLDRTIFFNDENSDYVKWTENDNPFMQNIDAVLSNFAVLNSIKNLETLSSKFALITHPGSQLIFSVLDTGIKNILSYNLPTVLMLYLSSNGFSTKVKFKDHEMVVYFHTKMKMIRIFKKYFNYVNSFQIDKSSFRLIHFTRNKQEVD